MIWAETKQEPLLENLNSKHKMIKFEHNISHISISFLDTLIDKARSLVVSDLKRVEVVVRS